MEKEKKKNEQYITHWNFVPSVPRYFIRIECLIASTTKKPWFFFIFFIHKIRQKILVSAFLRALKDPFPPARQAGILAMAATQNYYHMNEVACRLLPALCSMTRDPEKTVRDQVISKSWLAKDDLYNQFDTVVPCTMNTIRSRSTFVMQGSTVFCFINMYRKRIENFSIKKKFNASFWILFFHQTTFVNAHHIPIINFAIWFYNIWSQDMMPTLH